MTDFLAAVALLLVIEGLLYAAFPAAMQRMLAAALAMPPAALRRAGLIAGVAGIGLLWLVRGQA